MNLTSTPRLEANAESLSYSWQSNTFPSQSSTFCTFGCLILWLG
jgi:hypothetical protein